MAKKTPKKTTDLQSATNSAAQPVSPGASHTVESTFAATPTPEPTVAQTAKTEAPRAETTRPEISKHDTLKPRPIAASPIASTPAANTKKPEIVATAYRKNLVPINLEDEIRELAYLLSERRGFQPGYETEDWLNAERQVRERYQHQRTSA